MGLEARSVRSGEGKEHSGGGPSKPGVSAVARARSAAVGLEAKSERSGEGTERKARGEAECKERR